MPKPSYRLTITLAGAIACKACSTVVFDDANRKLPEIAAIRSGWFIDRFSLIRFTTPKAKSEDEPGRLGT